MAIRPSIEYIRNALDYDPATGIFRWKNPESPRMKPGDIAGTHKGNGYWVVHVKKFRFLAHRLAWLYVYGDLPDNHLDHINGDPSDNRIANLRMATPSQNAMNRRMRSDNATGYRGVFFDNHKKRYCAAIGVNRRIIPLGAFDTPEEAYEVYVAKARELHGEYTRA